MQGCGGTGYTKLYRCPAPGCLAKSGKVIKGCEQCHGTGETFREEDRCPCCHGSGQQICGQCKGKKQISGGWMEEGKAAILSHYGRPALLDVGDGWNGDMSDLPPGIERCPACVVRRSGRERATRAELIQANDGRRGLEDAYPRGNRR